jgi:flagellar basal-body rod protein FlgB
VIKQLFDTGAMPALERMIQFTGVRHRQIVHNIANLSTPMFRPRGLDPDSFQQALGEAIDRRRKAGGPLNGKLPMRDTRQLKFRPGRVEPRSHALDQNITFHDRNNRSLEHLMKDLATNTSAHNRSVRLIRNQFDMLETAIRERL